LTKQDCPVCQTGLSDFASSNFAVSFVKFQNHLFTPGDIKGLSHRREKARWWCARVNALTGERPHGGATAALAPPSRSL
jgi:hypothetical protein